MNITILCVILLACAAICFSSPIIKGCRCAKASKSVNASLITYVQVNDPRPYCNKQEVIVTLKDNTLTCLDPTARFTKLVLQSMQIKKNAAKVNATKSKTTTAPPSIPTTDPTTTPPTSP